MEIYRNCGKLLKSRTENVQVIVKEYLKVVEQAGYEMATQGELHEETKDNLDMELMSTVDYVKYLEM
ncbi:hypothetical protein [Sinanaerobacter sp. ZZT-01]|uniref:hypothetical protein n=1 Tax=Sinanaerobacter sp. ZZT-01 TaxID=3111540 RepID=UPI002D79B2D4|nr:hypothetical protein [Sinanaerobacter sp. ZZT-01]WRR92953.1 hypothetical protein U5921_13055 [Sinanaerobacter sp. ZZT-01]